MKHTVSSAVVVSILLCFHQSPAEITNEADFCSELELTIITRFTINITNSGSIAAQTEHLLQGVRACFQEYTWYVSEHEMMYLLYTCCVCSRYLPR